MEKMESTGTPASKETQPLSEMGLGALTSAAGGTGKHTLDVQLNWSEYFQGEWTTRESSGFGNSITPSEAFDPGKVFVTVTKETDPETGLEGAVWINLHGLLGVDEQVLATLRKVLRNVKYRSKSYFTPGFRVISKNSRPQLKPTSDSVSSPFSPTATRYNRYEGDGSLSVSFVQKIETTDGNTVVSAPAPQTILAKNNSFTLLAASNRVTLPNAEFAPLISPVFYADDINTFFVEPSLTETTVDKWQGYTITRPSQKRKWMDFIAEVPSLSAVIPPKYSQEALKIPRGSSAPDPIDPRSLHTLKPRQDLLTQSHVAVQFGDVLIGSKGRVQDLPGAGITHVITRNGRNL